MSERPSDEPSSGQPEPRRRERSRRPAHEREPGPGNVVELTPPEHRRDIPAPVSAPISDDAPRRERHRGPRHEEDKAPPVVGLGDHVPAFLLRTVKLPKTA